MRRNPFFKFLCTLILSFYATVAAQAGQVITREERDWAKQAIKQEARLGSIDGSNSVAVLNFHNLSGQQKLDALQKGLALMLITDLSKVESLVVIERIRMQALVDELDLGASGLVDAETAPQVGKFLKAYYVVSGDISSGSAHALELDSYLLDVPFENLTDLPRAAGSLDELYRMEKDILFQIIEELNVVVSAEKKRELSAPMSLSAAALFALFLGIDYSDRGMYEEAAQMYQKAIAEDSSLQIAEDSLQELTDMGLTSSEDISQVKPEEAVAAEGGSGAGTVLAVGLGLAAVGGGIALAVSASGSDDSDSESADQSPTTPTTPEPDSEPPTVTVTNSDGGSVSSVDCYSDWILFRFDQPMDTTAGSISPDPSFDGNISQNWDNNQTYSFVWKANYTTCYGSPSTFTFNLQNFVSESGIAPAGSNSISINVSY